VTLPRLRQVALVARQLEPVVEQIREAFGVAEPYRDPGVGYFGLQNAVFTVGDAFLEVVSPVQDGTAAGRQLERRGGDGGYMAMFEVADIAAARQRLRQLDVRVVFEIEQPDITDLHLHPRDVPGAIVALDQATPAGSWRWGGMDWQGRIPAHQPGGLRALTVAVEDPTAVAERWADVLGIEPQSAELKLPGQVVRFVPASATSTDITEATLALPHPALEQTSIGGVTFTVEPSS
jgi:hypothetical protein